jgi:hypothetical protein
VDAHQRKGDAVGHDIFEADVELARLAADRAAGLHADQSARDRAARDHYDAVVDDIVDHRELVMFAHLDVLAAELLDARQADLRSGSKEPRRRSGLRRHRRRHLHWRRRSLCGAIPRKRGLRLGIAGSLRLRRIDAMRLRCSRLCRRSRGDEKKRKCHEKFPCYSLAPEHGRSSS